MTNEAKGRTLRRRGAAERRTLTPVVRSEMEEAMQDEMMTKEHAQWPEFCKRMAVEAVGCKHTLDGAKRVLLALGWDDPIPSTWYLKQHGAFCDCEVMLNVVCA